MSWSGYIDLLGTRDIARLSSQDLQIYLDSFHSALADFIHEFDGDCFAFSDGAFFTCRKFDSFYPFFIRVRNQLFQADAYFRCSFLPGKIVVDDGNELKIKPLGTFVTYKFAGVAPEAYQAESVFKGVGGVVDLKKPRHEEVRERLKSEKSATKKEELSKNIDSLEVQFQQDCRKYLVDSFYISANGKKVNAVATFDFSYSSFEVGDSEDEGIPQYSGQQRLVDSLISSCYSSLARSSKISSYYLSALVSMIRCCDLKKSDWNAKDKSWILTPYAFRHLMSEGSLRLLKDVPGFHLVLLTAFDHLYRCKKDNGITVDLENHILSHLLKVGSCFRDLDSVQDFVISSESKKKLIELKLRDARSNKKR
ncbi:hypothetical protein [Novosphingobium lentum]|uniref:hypothetical protein n=1 Tax=Novosphingobium lentum TaxID=145287 RepID=UPI000A4C8C09|nr:hypothetical protein [Novosphingobium lentum]